MTHFNWTQLIPGVGHRYVHVATAAVATFVIVGFALAGRLALGNNQSTEPAGKFSVRGIWEVAIELIINLSDSVVGVKNRHLIPIFGSYFIYVLFNNLLGIIPGMTPATDNINTTLSLGLFSFVTYNILGVKSNGLAYFKHFLGPVLWLAPLMVVIEIISHLVRPMSLGLRLMGNMTGDHTVLSIFLDLVPIGLPVLFYILGLFVCFVQAFVFTLLSMVYVSMATAHDH